MTDHVRQSLRMAGRQMAPRKCSCGDLWPCPVATGDARWQALKDYLSAEITAHLADARAMTGRPVIATEHEARAAALGATLAKLDELQETVR